MSIIKINARSASALDATVLTGNLPAISGASLTGLSADFVKLQTQTVTGSTVANVTFTSTYLTSTYTTYFLTGWLILDNNAQLHAYCYPSINNGSSYNLDIAGYGEGRYNNVANTGTGEHTGGGIQQGSGDNRWCLSSDAYNGNQSAMQGSLMFSGYIVNSPDYTRIRSSTYYGLANRMYAGNASDYTTMPQYLGATSFETDSAINNIKIQASAGNIEIGSKFTLYGVKQ